VPTCPGTLTKVTPLKEVPTIPNATSIQLLFLFPIKKESLVLFLPVILATTRRIRKYTITKENKTMGDIAIVIFC
jgi:hypothetical protein